MRNLVLSCQDRRIFFKKYNHFKIKFLAPFAFIFKKYSMEKKLGKCFFWRWLHSFSYWFYILVRIILAFFGRKWLGWSEMINWYSLVSKGELISDDFYFKIIWIGISLVAQWLRIRLPIQGTRVRAPVWEDPTCCGATKPVHHNYWACTLEPTSHNFWARVPQLLKPTRLEPMLHNKRSHCNEKPTHRNVE